ncbi:helix-turn-helix domain-containing protein [Calidifontibacter sp. DB0510]|uniref:Helix-turn-helix domain-containing protein n=1 Tax=Metallococcus carri TaxID=1656884 RepID=A0A967B190_9MICO|nr:helix-turn-helix transcriptional regulator [Metallococcus carri]NHN56154.1 helix-turn-helix domain-containing protein [Metallococcus carri]NOP38795.1 helix-turn-helix domain-containing protein [Calidifontibacter sp. DB2511S]
MSTTAPAIATDPDQARRAELGSFLRSRRERLTPEQLGLPPTGRRRTPGLRREEVAQLANVSTTWYTWLEQGRDISVSAQVVLSLARALRLSPVERQYLSTLTHTPVQQQKTQCTAVSPVVQAMLDQLSPWPAFVQDLRGDILAYNLTYGHLLCDLDALPAEDRNCVWLAFTNEEWRVGLGDRVTEVRSYLVSAQRTRMAHTPNDRTSQDLVRRLQSVSEEFTRLWARHDVTNTADHPRKTFINPIVGELRFDVADLWLGPREGTRLLNYQPADQRTADRVRQLHDHLSA